MLRPRLAVALAAPMLLAAPSAASAADCAADGLRADLVEGARGAERVEVFDSRSGRPGIRVERADGATLASFFAFDPGFTGSVSVATGDVDGDGTEDVVVGAGPGGGPNVRVFDGATGARSADFFAFDPQFQGGVFVGVADVDGDGVDDILARRGGSSARAQKVSFEAFSGGGTILGPVQRRIGGTGFESLSGFCPGG